MATEVSPMETANNQGLSVGNVFHTYWCLAQCPKCGLVQTKSVRNCSGKLCCCFCFCSLCYCIRQLCTENDIVCSVATHQCPKCGMELGKYAAC